MEKRMKKADAKLAEARKYVAKLAEARKRVASYNTKSVIESTLAAVKEPIPVVNLKVLK